MTVTESEILQIKAHIHPIIGQKAWGVSVGVGSFITLEFGDPIQSTELSRSHGEWHLWIYYCAWRLEKGNSVLAGSEDPRPKLEQTVKCMEGLTLNSVEILPPALETIVRFSEQIVLRLFPIYSEEYEHWMLYTPNGNVLCIGPGSNWSYESSSAIPSD
jgi:hypothetical protein